MSTPTHTPLTARLRARQAAARCETAAANCQRNADAAKTPQGRQNWADLAADYRRTAAEWRAIVDKLTPEDTPIPGLSDDDCGECGGDHATDDHDSEAALDADADAYFDR